MKKVNDNKKLIEVSLGDKTYYLLGTAHISQESVEDVVATLQEIDPDVVAVELDKERLERIVHKNSDKWMDLDLFKVIKEGKSFLLLTSIVLASFQRKLGEHIDTLPGSEMITAVEKSKELGKQIVLVDRSVAITLRRAWRCSNIWGKQKIIAALLSVVFSKKKISIEEINELKDKSLEGNVLQELSTILPQLKTVLLDERDEYMATKLHNIKEKKILGIFGAAHIQGIQKKLEQKDENINHDERIKTLEYVPPKKRLTWLTVLIPVGIVALLVYSFINSGWQQVGQNIVAWWLINGIASAAVSLLVLAHPITLLVSFIAAPITSLSPLIGVSMFTGISETMFRKPTGRDIAELQELKLSIKSLYKNRVSRILLVILASSIGSGIGTFIGISFLAVNI